MSLLFNILSRLVLIFLPRSKSLLISSSVILEPKKVKADTVSIVSPTCLPRSDGTGYHDLRFLNVELLVSFFTLLSPRGSLVPFHFLP